MEFDPEDLETGLECACCQQDIETEDIISLQISQIQKIEGKIQFFPILNELNGDFQYPPLFIHLDACWKDVQDGAAEKVEDLPPVTSFGDLITCEFCHSGIRESEYLAFGEYGELHISIRQPDVNRMSYVFQPWKGRDIHEVTICLSCVTRIGEGILEDWDGVSQMGECVFCTYSHCWREINCSCFCHHEK